MPKYTSTANGLASLGRNGDTMLMHVNPQEVAGLSALLGSEPTINPDTGMPEAFSWLSPIVGLFGSVAEMGAGANIADWIASSDFAKSISDTIDPETLGTIGAGVGGSLLGAGIGAGTAALTGQNAGYGALGGAASGALAGGYGGMEKEALLGTPEMTEREKFTDSFFSEPNGPALKRSITPEERPGFFKTNFGSMQGMKTFAKEHGSVPVMTMGVGMSLAGTDEDRERMRQQQEFRRGQERQARRNAALYESYMQPYRFAGGGAVVTREPDAYVGQAAEYGVPITVRFPDTYVEQTKKAGGIENLLRNELGMAQGGYINTKPFDPENAHPLAMVDKANHYPAASPQRHEVVDAYYADGGFIDGQGDGMSDDIDANIDGVEPVKVADGEFIIPKDIVDMVGVDALDDMMKRVRMAAHGSDKQIKQDAAKKAFMQTVMG